MILFEVFVINLDLDNFDTKKSILFKTTVVFFMVFKFWIKSKQTNRVVDMNRVWQIIKNVEKKWYVEFDFLSYVSNHIS